MLAVPRITSIIIMTTNDHVYIYMCYHLLLSWYCFNTHRKILVTLKNFIAGVEEDAYAIEQSAHAIIQL